MNALACVFNEDLMGLRTVCTLAHNKQYDLEEVDIYGNTALLKACYLGKLEAVKILLRFRANINAINYMGQNALTLATYSRHEFVVLELLKYRSYNDFNLSSLIPAHCVAHLTQDRRMIHMFKDFDHCHGEDVITSHGLTPKDIQVMVNRLGQGRI